MTRLSLENLAVIALLGVLGILSVFYPIPSANDQLVATIAGVLGGYLAKSSMSPAKQDPPPLPTIRPMPDLDMPEPPAK